MNLLLKICFIFLLISCGAGISDMEVDLGDNYYLLLWGGDNDKIYSKSKKDQKWIFSNKIVGPNVESVKYNDKFILVERNFSKRIIVDSIMSSLRNSYYYVVNNSIEGNRKIIHKRDSIVYKKLKELNYINDNKAKDKAILKKVADSIFKLNFRLNNLVKYSPFFYIIDKKNKILHGPYSKKQFERQKDILNISNSTELHFLSAK